MYQGKSSSPTNPKGKISLSSVSTMTGLTVITNEATQASSTLTLVDPNASSGEGGGGRRLNEDPYYETSVASTQKVAFIKPGLGEKGNLPCIRRLHKITRT